MKSIAIITARGGSRRIPKKNIKNFFGKPIISYSIETAIAAGCFDEVMVSTDDYEIAEVAKKLGAKIPFMRSKKNSDDFSTTADVLVEVIEEYNKQNISFDYFCCLYPAAPFVTAKMLQESFDLFVKNSDAKTLVPITKFSSPIQRCLVFNQDHLRMKWPENMNVRSQDLEPTYHDIGQFYWARTSEFIRDKKLFTDKTLAYEVPEYLIQDIDTLMDWEIAEFKYKYLFEKGLLE